MKKGCHNYAHMHDLVTATDDVKSLFVLTLGKLVCIKDSTNNIWRSSKGPCSYVEMVQVLWFNFVEDVCDREQIAETSERKQDASHRMEMILIKVWHHHDNHCKCTESIYQTQIEPSPFLQLVTCETIVERWSATSSDHQTNTCIVKPNEKVHHLFWVGVVQVVECWEAKAEERTYVVKNQGPSWSIMDINTLLWDDGRNIKKVELWLIDLVFHLLFPILYAYFHKFYKCLHLL